MLNNGRRSLRWFGGYAVAAAVFAGASCDEEEPVKTEFASLGSGNQGGLFMPEPPPPEPTPLESDAQSSSTPTDPPIVAESGGAADAGANGAGSDASEATSGEASSTEDNWPTVDGGSKGTPAAAGPGGSIHTTNHADPSKGKNRNKLVPEGSSLVSFEELASFWYEAPEPEEVVENPDFKPEDQFPEFLKKMDGDTVSVEGYVVPISIEKGRVKAFILSRYVANCCFGLMPELNEWVEVEMPEGKGLDFLPYGTVMTTGKLSVGEVFDEYGYVRCLYRIDATSVVEPDY